MNYALCYMCVYTRSLLLKMEDVMLFFFNSNNISLLDERYFISLSLSVIFLIIVKVILNIAFTKKEESFYKHESLHYIFIIIDDIILYL